MSASASSIRGALRRDQSTSLAAFIRGATAGLFLTVTLSAAQRQDSAEALLDLLVLYEDPAKVDSATLPLEARAGVDAYKARLRRFTSRLPAPQQRPSEMKMVHAAHIGYERKLAAFSDDPEAPALAAEYVRRLRPCYEWEGLSECPEREARFADRYREEHPGGPFTQLLTLLSAHRWLCAAEGYEFETRPHQAASARTRSEARLFEAERSPEPLIRIAAAALARRASCHSGR